MSGLEKEEVLLDWGNSRGIYHLLKTFNQSLTSHLMSSGDHFPPPPRG